MKRASIRYTLLLPIAIMTGCGGGASNDYAGVGLGNAASSYYDREQGVPPHNTEDYDFLAENDFVLAEESPLSTFSVDVDTASYANVRRLLKQGQVPPAGAVRIEELINYFRYEYLPPNGEHPFAVHVDYGLCPWNPKTHIARIALQGKRLEYRDQRPRNLVFLLDVSGSMQDAKKLPLVKAAMRMLLDQLGETDRIAIVVYAGASGVALPSTPATEQLKILESLEALSAKGSTNGGAGIRLAYRIARENYVPGGINRVMLCTDGDFNVGVTDNSSLVELIQSNAKSNVFLSILAFGTGNLNDSMMEQLSGHGNGTYAYIDTLREARKNLIEQMEGTLVTIAKDVKIQVDFNPRRVREYRLIGYENRVMASKDFTDDTRDAGDIGAGHAVTALYEIMPAGKDAEPSPVEPSKYVKPEVETMEHSNELLTVRLRYKLPAETKSRAFRLALVCPQQVSLPSGEFGFACAVAEFGMKLRNSKYLPPRSWDEIRTSAIDNLGPDRYKHRAEFVRLITMAQRNPGGAWKN